MKVNKSIIMLILVIFLFSLNSVWAGEIDDMASDDTGQIALSSNDKIIEDNLKTSEGNVALGESDDSAKSDVSLKSSDSDMLSSSGEFGELQNLIDDASENSIISLGHNYTYTIGTDTITEGISINKNLTINGNGFAINAQGKSRIFNIESGIKEIVLDSDIILDNNESSDSIYAVKLDVNGLVLDGNGYAIDGNNNSCMLLCTGENITIKNIIIKNIKFQNPLMKKGRWSALTNCKGQLNIINSIFKDNYGFGGAISNYGTLGIIQCKFIHNSAGRVGGAIYNDGGLIMINNSIFINNEAIHDGGAIYAPRGLLNIRNSEFSNNFAGYDGGAIYSRDNVLNLKNCTFKDNKYDDVCK